MFRKIYPIKARHLFANGCTIYLCAKNLRPDMFAVAVNAGELAEHHALTFDRLLAEFKYYNCINAETGHTVACYVKEGE